MVVATRCKGAPGASQRPPDLAAHPSEEELLACFLRPRVDSGASPCAFIHEADVYSDDPAELTCGFAPAVASNGDAAWYFFSAVRTKTRDGQRKARTVETGDGCWHSEAGAKPVADEAGRCLGHRQSFSFVTKADGRRVRSGWLMVELGLDGADDLALCKVYFSPRARPGPAVGPSCSSAAASPGRKRKAAADDKEDPAPARQRLQHALPTEAGAPHDDVRPSEAGAAHDDVRPAEAGAPHDDGVTADADEDESTEDDGGLAVADESSAADGAEEFWSDGTFFYWWTRNRDRLMEEYGVVVMSDEKIPKAHRLDEILDLLNLDDGDSPPI